MLIGFGADDPVLRGFLQMLPALADDAVPEHFAVLDGPCSAEAKRRLLRRGFLVLDGEARHVLRALGGTGELHPSTEHTGECPYPGLEAFDEGRADVFFGRHVEVSQATARLGEVESGEHRRWLAVEGPSGVGKSSFVHAGVIPALRHGFATGTPSRWVVARMRPGVRPLANLVEAVVAVVERRARTEELVEQVRERPGALAEWIAKRVPAGYGLALVIDQLEEAVTFARESERAPFGRAVAAGLDEGSFYLVTTIREDFISALQARLPSLASLLNERAERYALPPISRVGLRDAIAEPAAREGVMFEEGLLEIMIADADSGGEADEDGDEGGEVRSAAGALPLVAHALRTLWDAGAAEDRVIEKAEYRAIGGVKGALSRSAERALAGLDAATLEQVDALLLGLVRVHPDGGETRRTIERDEAVALAGGGDRGEMLLLRLSGAGEGSKARLLVIHREGERERVDLVHEALLRDWERYAVLIERNRRQLLLDDELERRAKRWEEMGRPEKDLPAGQELAELLEGRPRGAGVQQQRAYQAALRGAETRRRRRQRALQVTAVMVLVGIAVASLVASRVLAKKNTDIEEKAEALEREKNKAEEEQDRANRELVKQKGQRASMLAKSPGNELAALALAVDAVGGLGTDMATIPEPVFTGLVGSVMGIEAGLPLRGLEDKVVAIAVHPDGSRIATASLDKTVRLWDANSGALVQTLEGHEGPVRAVVFSRDGSQLATASGDKTARVWEVATGKELSELEHEGELFGVALSPDGGRVATAGIDGKIRIWDVAKSEELFSFGHEKAAKAVAWSPDGKQLASASLDGTARVWSANDGAAVTSFAGHSGEKVHAVAWSPDGSRVVSGAEDGFARMWDATSGEEVAVFDHGESVRALAFSSDGKYLASGTFDDDAAHLWEVESGGLIRSFRHAGPVMGVAWSPDGMKLATASWDKTGKSWEVRTSEALRVLEGHRQGVYAIAVSPDGTRIATGSGDDTARLWDAKTGAVVAELRGHIHDLSAVSFSADGSMLATASWDGTARLWGGRSGEFLRALKGHAGRVHAVALSPDGSRVATASADETVRVWDAATGEELRTIPHETGVVDVMFSPDGGQLLTVTSVNTAHLWASATGEAAELAFAGPVTAAAFSPDGARLALATKGHVVQLWDRSSNAAVKAFTGHSGPVLAMTFSADGAFLATASNDGSARIWDTATDDDPQRAALPHEGPVFDVAFTVDGAGLATVSGDAVARVWAVAPEPWLGWGCALLESRGAHQDETRAACASQSGEVIAMAKTLAEATVIDGDGPQYEVIVEHGVELVLIPRGTFLMGSPEGVGEPDERPQHEVTLDGFYMARTELTNAQYAVYLDANPNVEEPLGWADRYGALYNQPDQPVIGLGWSEAKAYCDWAGFVLPTEAQWEYAARAGTTTAHWYGDELGELDRFGWYLDNSGRRPHSVARKGANAFGLYDMGGNLREWTLDAYGDYATSPRSGDGLRHEPVSDASRVIRGGGWSIVGRSARSGCRDRNHPGFRYGDVGFRPLRAIP